MLSEYLKSFRKTISFSGAPIRLLQLSLQFPAKFHSQFPFFSNFPFRRVFRQLYPISCNTLRNVEFEVEFGQGAMGPDLTQMSVWKLCTC